MKGIRAFLDNLEIGSRKPLLVRRESLLPCRVGKRILFASDLHLRTHGPARIVDALVDVASRESPDLILLGGDLVDGTGGLQPLRSLIHDLSGIAPVGAVSGNHDRWIGVAGVRAAVLAGGGRWLEDTPWKLTSNFAIYGSSRQTVPTAKYHLLCTHHPASTSRHFDLTLSGHLHGGQFVFYERHGKLYPGAFLYRWNGLRFDQANGTTLLISRGVHDSLPVRWNCPREVIVVSI